MDYKKLAASAIIEAEKEKQEQEIKKIKEIVKSYLEKIFKAEEKRKEIDTEIKTLKADLENLKAGRLDRIMEKQEKDKEHDKYTLIIIKKIEKEYIPYQPWRSPWIVEWKSQSSQHLYTTISTNLTNVSTDSCVYTGTSFQNFCGGTYNIGGKIINL